MVGEVAAPILSFFAGISSKVSDSGRLKYSQEIAGFVNGILLAALTMFPVVREIVLGGTAGVILAGKVDKRSHYIAVSTFLLLYALAPKEVTILPLIISCVTSYFDERFSERKDLLGQRILLPLAVVVLVPVIGFLPLATMIAYDLGYRGMSAIYRAMQGLKQLS